MLTASQLVDKLGAMVMAGSPPPPGASVRVMESNGTGPNWIADVSAPLPLEMAERWVGAVAQLQWNAPAVDFSGATQELDGARGVERDLSDIDRGAEFGASRGRIPAATPRGDAQRTGLRAGIAWIAGVPAALALLALALVAMTE